MIATRTHTRPVKPATARVSRMLVARAQRVGSGFVRVTLTGADGAFDASFEPMGFDQWFRLFLPVQDQAEPVLGDDDSSEGWYTRWLKLGESERPVVRNYTIREARRVDGSWQIDVDFVVHRSPVTGLVDGVAASWALNARPGDRVAVLDQGTIFNPMNDDGAIVIVADETGLPGVEGIARSLGAGQRAVLVLEVAHEDDRREIESAADIRILWSVRPHGGAVGSLALERLAGVAFTAEDYVYAVGEGSFVLAARSLARSAGVPKASVDFCAYWKVGRR